MKTNTAGLVGLLDDIKARVAAGDSFEGNLNYTCMAPHLGTHEWEVVGAYRVGNSEGQGGMTVLEPSPEAV